MYYNDYRPEEEQPIHVDRFSVDGKPSRRKQGRVAKIIALCLVFTLLGGIAGGAVTTFLGSFLPLPKSTSTIYTGNRQATAIRTVKTDTRTLMTLPEIYYTYVGSTVGITVDVVSTNIFGQTVKSAAAGSGFVLTSDGYIATNYHVIDNANSITVAFVDGSTYPAVLVGGDDDNDIAVLKIEATGLTPVVLGDSGAMLVGEQVAAIGNPLGELTFTLTSGYVSALDRSITMSDGTVMTMIQTDTAINSGNSGGPLFNMYGEVIGITSAKYSGQTSSSATIEGIGFAIPINKVANMMKEIIEHGYVTGKPFLGISIQNVDSLAKDYGIPEGVRVTLVTPGLAADKAGIKEGDIITAVNGKQVTSVAALKSEISKYKAGETAQFSIYRSGQTLTLSVTFDEENTETTARQNEYVNQRNQQQSQPSSRSQQRGGGFFSWPFFW